MNLQKRETKMGFTGLVGKENTFCWVDKQLELELIHWSTVSIYIYLTCNMIEMLCAFYVFIIS